MSILDEKDLRITDTVTIPLSELRFRFARSGGPGGQHANRSATQVELLFDVAHSPSLTAAQRERVLARLGSRVDGDGVLHLVSETHRSQRRNREEVVERFVDLMRQGLQVPKRRRPTRVPRAVREARLVAKRRRSAIKRRRRRMRPGEGED